ncbi:MAG: hypothetical protein H7Z43_13655 [Clostridia bacterium]|nr:hypothetical protein [Deltaproteobacteria bacterium]
MHSSREWCVLQEYFEPGAADGKRLFQFENYAVETYGIAQGFRHLTDTRRSPTIPTFEVVNALFRAEVPRIPSLNEAFARVVALL